MKGGIGLKFIDLLEKLPPAIARKNVEKYLGGAISQKTLSNLESAGKLAVEKIKCGRTVVYDTASLLAWLDQR